ncbi:MAG: hypothetical protein RIS35_1536 [Pseudomonadota bacterium]
MNDFLRPIVVVGFGAVGRAVTVLLLRHWPGCAARLRVIDPDPGTRSVARALGCEHLEHALTPENFGSILDAAFGRDARGGILLNLANEVSSVDLIRYAACRDLHYLDTVVEPWPGFYFDGSIDSAARSNYRLRESVLAVKRELGRSRTAISCCGANPGLVSWLLKRALLDLARDLTGRDPVRPRNRTEWAALMRSVGVKGVQIAERDTQSPVLPRRPGTFTNTWSARGFLAEAAQPAELGWGSHERRLPDDGSAHASGCGAAIWLDRPGGDVRVRTWTPSSGPQTGFLITHNEAISIADHYSVWEDGRLAYRPTCYYAYRPADVAVASLREAMSLVTSGALPAFHVLAESEILSGFDELGVLLFGHARGAYWYGSTLSIERARALAPWQNATGLQVAAGVLAGLRYAIAHPFEGVIEADEMDHDECLEVALPYLGEVAGHYTDWVPSVAILAADEDPWRFERFRVDLTPMFRDRTAKAEAGPSD